MTTGVLAPPSQTTFTDTELYRQLQQVYGLLTGEGDWGVAVSLTACDDDSEYSLTAKNNGAGGALLVLSSGGALRLAVSDTEVTISSLHVTGNSVLDGTLAAGASTLSSLHVTGNSVLDGTLTAGASTLSSLHVTGDATIDGNLTAKGNTALGDQNTDTLTVIGVSTFRNAAASATQLKVDAGNNRVIVGSSTALGSDTTPALHVVGRLYVAPDAANDTAFQVRRSSAATVGFTMGVSSGNDFLFKDDSDTETFRVGDVASTYQAKITGKLQVTSTSQLDGAVTVSAGGIGVTGSSVFNSGLTVLSGLTVTTGVLTLSAQPHARAYNSANISHTTSGSWQVVTLDSERYDVGGMHSTSSNTSRLTAPTAGYYSLKANLGFAANATGFRGVAILLNGSTTIAIHMVPAVSAASDIHLSVACDYTLAANDYLEMIAYQSSGAALNILAAGNYTPEFSAAMLG